MRHGTGDVKQEMLGTRREAKDMKQETGDGRQET